MSKQNAAGAAPQENKMGVLPVGKLLAGMAVPMMISMLVQALYNIVDSVFVSRLSENAFNAVGLAFPLQSLMIAVGAGTAVGINALLSRSLGEKKQEMADRAAGAGIFLLPICSYLVFAFIGLFLSRPFFVAQAKAVPEIVEYGVQYTRICLGLSVGIFSQFCFERLLQSTGRTSLAMCTQLLGAIINIGAIIGEGTMIDMGAVLGGRATVGKNCHIGAGAVLAGVVEPASATPVIIEDNVLVGANAVIIEGVHVGEGAVVAAGAIVIEDVPAHTVVAGTPARVIKQKDEKATQKTALVSALRSL